MDVPQPANDEQTNHWSTTTGCAWVDAQDLLDRMMKGLEELLVDAVAAGSGRRVLDVGCGTGGTTLAVARRLGAEGQCVGADVSEPMIAAARARAERDGTPASFILADVQTHPFEPASVDTIISRFGVMFFNDPVEAFANLRRAATDDGALHLVAWRSAAENPFMTTGLREAAPLLPNIAVPPADGPGQFSFGDPQRVAAILDSGGWTDVDLQPIDVGCALPEPELIGFFTRLGPVGLALQGADERTRARVIEAVRPAFDPFVHGTEVRYTAACWMISAQVSA
ncbi:SAM-dependent methyltransferase [Mycolicibacterium sp. BK556]|uniref:class I SAM-dependent methyltransferase n=1 Tax=Mycobacteriaceae TaxID=1762 RepID=UPI0010608153|nr:MULTISPECIES: class I SAM-dependent methyltransferase [Mycobacteriaceae]MBB3600675.1 SAM-dependent methyltransferase [Mycolicibacterium sp. BK556]MBB3630428.1 SAM-dependent methyltransferase [Mycolicibacterium sp. BK607]TDO10215.1 ubiquinone/menaquinone biosynthesis C-methylase UbiE [Mycobacterium sp. BK086]